MDEKKQLLDVFQQLSGGNKKLSEHFCKLARELAKLGDEKKKWHWEGYAGLLQSAAGYGKMLVYR